MFVKVVSVNENIDNTNIQNSVKKFAIKEVFLNKNLVISISEDERMNELSDKNKLPSGFPKNQKFSKISINKGNFGEDMCIVGDVELITKLFEAKNGK
jgi:hypothetical protein